jgi:hypothetical protein
MWSKRKLVAGLRTAPLFIVLCLCVYLGGCSTVGIEKPKYSVLEKQRRFELRLYEPCIVAETVVESAFADAGNIAFRRLYNYI